MVHSLVSPRYGIIPHHHTTIVEDGDCVKTMPQREQMKLVLSHPFHQLEKRLRHIHQRSKNLNKTLRL